MAKVITKQVKGKSEIDGLEVTKIIQVCENCGSEKVNQDTLRKTKENKIVVVWVCWGCEVSYDNSSKTANERNQERVWQDMEVSLEARQEVINKESDRAYLVLDDEIEAVEFDVFCLELPLTESQKNFCRMYANTGTLEKTAEAFKITRPAVKQAFNRIEKSLLKQGITKEIMKSWLYPDYS